MRRLLIPLVVTAVLLGACGGGGSAISTKPAGQAVATKPTGAGPAGVTSTTSAPQFSGSGGSSWCDYDRQLQNSTQFQNLYKDPHGWVSAVNSVVGQVESKAPGVIKADVATIVEGLHVVIAAVVADNYDFSKITPAQMAPLQDLKFKAAGDRVTAYDKQVCGTKG